jgi:hypothetical protein
MAFWDLPRSLDDISQVSTVRSSHEGSLIVSVNNYPAWSPTQNPILCPSQAFPSHRPRSAPCQYIWPHSCFPPLPLAITSHFPLRVPPPLDLQPVVLRDWSECFSLAVSSRWPCHWVALVSPCLWFPNCCLCCLWASGLWECAASCLLSLIPSVLEVSLI